MQMPKPMILDNLRADVIEAVVMSTLKELMAGHEHGLIAPT
jgi:hypothetical protein